jgi:NAD(P)-dependent dehydrogenase (short-subunit alcohol dehydrogenase family)
MSLRKKEATMIGRSSGIGRAISLRPCQAGGKHLIDYVVHPKATGVPELDIAVLRNKAVGGLADFSRTKDLEKLVDSAARRLGRVDIGCRFRLSIRGSRQDPAVRD